MYLFINLTFSRCAMFMFWMITTNENDMECIKIWRILQWYSQETSIEIRTQTELRSTVGKVPYCRCMSDCRFSGSRFHIFMEFDHEIISTVILVNHSCLLNRRLYKRPRYWRLTHLIAADPINTISALIDTKQRLRRYFFCIYEYDEL